MRASACDRDPRSSARARRRSAGRRARRRRPGRALLVDLAEARVELDLLVRVLGRRRARCSSTPASSGHCSSDAVDAIEVGERVRFLRRDGEDVAVGLLGLGDVARALPRTRAPGACRSRPACRRRCPRGRARRRRRWRAAPSRRRACWRGARSLRPCARRAGPP